MYENLDFIQGSYMISLVSYKDHIWFLWSHTRIIHFFKRVFLLFLNAILELFIYDFLDFMLGSCMKTWISYKDHVWFLWFHTRIVLRNRVWTVWNHIWSLYEIKETSTRAAKTPFSVLWLQISSILRFSVSAIGCFLLILTSYFEIFNNKNHKYLKFNLQNLCKYTKHNNSLHSAFNLIRTRQNP